MQSTHKRAWGRVLIVVFSFYLYPTCYIINTNCLLLSFNFKTEWFFSALKTPPAFHEQRQKLERAKMGDLLKAKIQQRPDRQELVRQHILEGKSSYFWIVAFSFITCTEQSLLLFLIGFNIRVKFLLIVKYCQSFWPCKISLILSVNLIVM